MEYYGIIGCLWQFVKESGRESFVEMNILQGIEGYGLWVELEYYFEYFQSGSID